MTSYQINLQTIPGRDIRPNTTIDRSAWLRRYLDERAAFAWSPAYQERQAELAKLEQEQPR